MGVKNGCDIARKGGSSVIWGRSMRRKGATERQQHAEQGFGISHKHLRHKHLRQRLTCDLGVIWPILQTRQVFPLPVWGIEECSGTKTEIGFCGLPFTDCGVPESLGCLSPPPLPAIKNSVDNKNGMS